MRHLQAFLIVMLILIFTSCKKQRQTTQDSEKPIRVFTSYFDNKYLLYLLPGTYYDSLPVNNTFNFNRNRITLPSGLQISYQPLGYPDSLHLQYTHVYSDQCVYHVNDTTWKYAEVCFPNTCLTKNKAYADIRIENPTGKTIKLHIRLFYQNTSYWRPTNKVSEYTGYLDNYYGCSELSEIEVEPNSDKAFKISYSIGLNPKHEFDFDPSKDPARPGNYEFMLVVDDKANNLLSPNLDLRQVNPFAEVQKQPAYSFLYTPSEHFKFVFLDEYFDGTNDLSPNHVYIAKHGMEKKLCDTCTGWYRNVLSEIWNSDDYFNGFINSAPFIKAEYGIRKENCRIDSTGITLKIPGSKRGDYKKTWGEFLFGPPFKYGHLTVRAKFAQMYNKIGHPNGIVHNLWLYQRDPDLVDSTSEWKHLVNDSGKQPYEIDFEIWSSMEGVNTMWDDNAFINYSIVDYMRNPEVQLRPGEMKQMGKYKAERLNQRQAGIPGVDLNKSFFDSFHTYELFWYPDKVVFKLDRQETAVITPDMAAIPDKYMFLWIGSPLYQDGTYYTQSNIPFLKHDKYSVIDYIRIE